MLRSVVEQMGATGFAQAALILFFSVFISVLIRESLRSKREVRHLSDLPLAEDAPILPAAQDFNRGGSR